jgi:hypothetical protein
MLVAAACFVSIPPLEEPSATTSTGGEGGTQTAGSGGTAGSAISGGGGHGQGGEAGGGPDAYAAAVLQDGPLGYWRLDDVGLGTQAFDSSGNGYHGTYIGGVSAAPGAWDGSDAARFPATSDVVEVDGPFGFGGVAPFSAEALVFIEGYTGIFVAKKGYSSGDHTGWWFGIRDSPPAIRIDRAVSGSPSLATGEPPLTTWMHVVATFDGTTAKLYFDGELDPTVRVQSGDLAAVSEPLTIGNAAVWTPFDGVLDEVAVYDQALPAVRVQAHYEAWQSLVR